MKTKKIIIAVMLAVIPFWSFAQEWDDIYATPSQNKGKTTKSDSQQKKKVVIVEGKGTDIKVQAETRDIDEYNRRGTDVFVEEEMSQDSLYQDYEYTDRIIKYHDPETSIKISGVDEVTIYVDGDVYSEYYRNRAYNRGYYGSFYYPWYTYDYMYYDPWYYGYGFSTYYYGWYNPWFRPWGYSFYFSPWYYGGWYYSPYWYSSYWYYGGGGYYNGFYDGYHSALITNRSGRSSGTFRTSSANTSRLSTSGRTSASTRTSSATGRISSHSSRDASSTYRRNDASTGRTRIVDNSGRVVDSRTGRTINRETTSRQRPRNYNNSVTTTRPTSTYQRDAVKRRTNSAPFSLNRPTSTRNNNSSVSSSGNSSRNSSFSNSSSSSSSRSSSFNSSSSSSSSRSSSSSSGRSSGRRN